MGSAIMRVFTLCSVAMNDNFSQSQHFRKTTVMSDRGIVAAQHRVAAQAGAAVLAQGGDCVDAVVATSFALGAVEPWMSGIGGGGAMVLYRAKEQRYEVIDFGMCSSHSLNPADYPITGEGVAADIFPWPRVKDDLNLHGPMSIAVPGVVAGMDSAHQRYARLSWRDVVTPAVELAGQGLLVDWYSTINIATAAAQLRNYPDAAAEFLRDGLPPVPMWGIKSSVRLPRPRYAATLATIASEGAKTFYDGDVARSLSHDVNAAGGCLTTRDLADYRASVLASLAIPYRGAMVHATPQLTAGPTLAHALNLMSQWQPHGDRPDAAAYVNYASALQSAYRERLDDMGDAHGRRAIGAQHLAPSCTSHFSVVDRDGNMAAVTQTLLGIFGSKFVAPQSGILMNNGIMWFDPEPNKANSLAPGKRCLCNYTPVIAQVDNDTRVAIGASGGRRILPAVAQLVSFAVDYRMDLDKALHTPRIDASEGPVVIGDERLDAKSHAALASNFDYERARLQELPLKFACPSVVMRVADRNSGATEIFQPWGDAVAG